MNPYQVVKTISLTEKANLLIEEMKYTFIVDPRADKLQVKKAVEYLFDRKVAAVNLQNRRGKPKRTRYGLGKRADWKKAIVTLRAGEAPIDVI